MRHCRPLPLRGESAHCALSLTHEMRLLLGEVLANVDRVVCRHRRNYRDGIDVRLVDNVLVAGALASPMVTSGDE